MTNEVIKAMIERRSCRKFKVEQIKDEELQAILEAGKYAATGKGLQSPKMVVIQNPEVIAKLSKWNADIMGVTSDPFYGAPTVILVLADATRPTAVQDGSLVMGNLMLAAHSIGVASCWINRAKEEFATEEGKALLKQWGIEGDYIGVGHCVLGYPAVDLPKPAPRKDDYVVFVK
ncbi:nitroreductase family protein [Megamonas funiformis]|uniref:nitroreductase family protein n=1 Tax=Megamonas funiformis TaxID=437897 RepID=UPI003AF4925B